MIEINICHRCKRRLLDGETCDCKVCPNDTNGDGDCGRPLCPICGEANKPLLEQIEWRRTAQEQPANESTILMFNAAWVENGDHIALGYYDHHVERFRGDAAQLIAADDAPTHWAYLPEGPK